MYLVNLSLAYFHLYEKNFEKSLEITNELLRIYPNSHEVQTLSYILYLEQLKNIDTKTENKIYEKMTILTKNEINSTSIHDYTFVVLEKLYLNQNDKFNAFLAKNINYLDTAVFDLDFLEKFENFMQNPKDSKIKEHFALRYAKQNLLKEQNNCLPEGSFADALRKDLIEKYLNNISDEDIKEIEKQIGEDRKNELDFADHSGNVQVAQQQPMMDAQFDQQQAQAAVDAKQQKQQGVQNGNDQ